MIKAVLFDLDRTLLDRDTSFRNFVISQYEKFSHQLVHIQRDAYVNRVVALDNRGLLWKDQVYKTVTQEFSISALSWEQLFADFDERIAAYYVAFPDTHEMLDALKRRGHKLALVTNGKGYFQRRTIEALNLESSFDTILISEEEGVRKPELEIFLRALSRLDCKPDESVFVGDSIEADIRGAKRAGLLAVWMQDTLHIGSVDADAIVTDLKNLPAIIEQLETRRAS